MRMRALCVRHSCTFARDRRPSTRSLSMGTGPSVRGAKPRQSPPHSRASPLVAQLVSSNQRLRARSSEPTLALYLSPGVVDGD